MEAMRKIKMEKEDAGEACGGRETWRMCKVGVARLFVIHNSLAVRGVDDHRLEKQSEGKRCEKKQTRKYGEGRACQATTAVHTA